MRDSHPNHHLNHTSDQVEHADLARTHVVTGGTGFVGSALILELLQRTSGQVIALVRPKAGSTPSERLEATLSELIDGYALPESVRHEVATRVRAIAGDIEQDNCGVSPSDSLLLSSAEFWHCAASLQYQDRHREQSSARTCRAPPTSWLWQPKPRPRW